MVKDIPKSYKKGFMSAWNLDRREFLKVLTAAVATLGFPASSVDKVEAAVATKKKANRHLAQLYGMHRLHRNPFKGFSSTLGKVFARNSKP